VGDLAIEIHDVSKMFRLNVEKHSTMKERAIRIGRRPPVEEFWALRDIDFEVESGHTVGLIGHNGSGKSTLLKCIGGILRPTKGQIRSRGRIASLLEVGAGFHPDLTGRENIYLNASILGFSRKDTEARFDDIVAFAGLERFIDQQVKRYSSGMYMRLGFSVATSVDPEILLVDEVLAVGDEAFQRKCLDRILGFQRDGRTIVFVTHAADQVRQICDRAVVLDKGKLVTWGTPSEGVRTFRELLYGFGEDDPDSAVTTGDRHERVRIRAVQVEYPDPERPYVRNGEPLEIHIGYEALEPVDDAVFVVALHNVEGHVVFGQNTWGLGERLPTLQGTGEVTFRFEATHMLEGTYPLTVGIHERESGAILDWREQYEHVDVINLEGNHAWGVADLEVKVDLSKLNSR
jgi:ABC-2 type transport system ATP-binding protein